jgi:hypothetical protein
METQTTEQLPRKKNAYNKERYEQNKEEILKYRRERYRTIHKRAIELFLYTIFILLLLCYYYYIIVIIYYYFRK